MANKFLKKSSIQRNKIIQNTSKLLKELYNYKKYFIKVYNDIWIKTGI